MRLRPALTKLLVILLLLQWGTAFGHCLRLATPPAGLVVELCTPDGLHRITLPGEERDSAPKLAAMVCPACQGPADVALPPPPVTLAPPVVLAQAPDPQAPPPPPRPASPPRSCQPRAPPTS